MKIIKKTIIVSMITLLLLISSNTLALQTNNIYQEIKEYKKISTINNNKNLDPNTDSQDLDPLLNLKVTVNIREIRALDDIDLIGDPDFYVVVYINDVKQVSPIWYNQRYIKDDWSTQPIDVPDDKEDVKIKIQLWDKNLFIDKKCDINSNVNTSYLDKTGKWLR